MRGGLFLKPTRKWAIMPLFFFHLIAYRPNFAASMTDDERATMGAHVAYMQDLLQNGSLVVAGPVFDPNGSFGMGVFDVSSMDEVQAIQAKDPAAKVGRYEVSPMGPSTYRPA